MFRWNHTSLSSNKSKSHRELRYATSPPLLPPELIESIIDEVGLLDDIPTLKACALVATPFVFRAQSHIFRTIDLDRKVPRWKTHHRFHRLLLAKPHLGLHVRRIRVGDDAEDEFGSRGGSSRRRAGGGGGGWGNSATWNGAESGGWILSSKTLPITLQLLPRLEGFSLSFNSEMTDWRIIPPETRAAIGRLFRLPTLNAVSLEFIRSFPLQHLLSLARLRYIGLSCVEVEPMTIGAANMLPPELAEGRWVPRLESLYLRGTSSATIKAVAHSLTLSSSSPSPQTLKKLSITPTFEEGFCDSISEMINATGSNITVFEWLPSIHFCFVTVYAASLAEDYSSRNRLGDPLDGSEFAVPSSFAPLGSYPTFGAFASGFPNPYNRGSSIGSINMGALPYLRVLRFLVSFRKTHSHGPFPEVLRLLGQISSSSSNADNAHTHTPNRIETIIFDCHCIRTPTSSHRSHSTLENPDADLKSLHADWRPIDKILSRPAFASLKSVQIRLSTSTSVPAARERFTRAFAFLLPALQARGVGISVRTREDGDERFVLEDFGI
ncbi:hypothetical protein JR316_0002870 [Psilocybe cubensis]|uniref:Uncharacterized protein n=1 Tax=Psilocybe cubensis TaxID=181762 RepID=A0ACB8H6Q5_PSICU|nr:hypothetical protein JR316_0002870 [Psilocybe cubensis]KAH9483404.1 hypothetical protein JR316_0002870 [Psilocybe cubensis]